MHIQNGFDKISFVVFHLRVVGLKLDGALISEFAYLQCYTFIILKIHIELIMKIFGLFLCGSVFSEGNFWVCVKYKEFKLIFSNN